MAKYAFILIIVAGCYNTTLKAYQVEPQAESDQARVYSTLAMLSEFPIGNFNSIYPKKVLWGFSYNIAFRQVKQIEFWQPGIQWDFTAGAVGPDKWNGIKVKTRNFFNRLYFFNRFMFSSHKRIEPFIELSFGVIFSNTDTHFVIKESVAEIIVEILLDEDFSSETVILNEHMDMNWVSEIGVGVLIDEVLVVAIKYNHSPLLEYVSADNLTIFKNNITYMAQTSSFNIISVNLGISF